MVAKINPYLWRIIHWVIILNFLLEIGYAAYMVFVVVTPTGGGPLAGKALEIPFEMMVTRRLYAIEAWIAMLGLSLYLAITEIYPRFWQNKNYRLK